MSNKQTVGASVSPEMKARIKRTAEAKYWSVGQTLGLFIEKYWEEWEKELGLNQPVPSPKSNNRQKPKKE